MIATMTKVVAGEVDSYRNLEPQSMVEETKKNIEAPWTTTVRDGRDTRSAQVLRRESRNAGIESDSTGTRRSESLGAVVLI